MSVLLLLFCSLKGSDVIAQTGEAAAPAEKKLAYRDIYLTEDRVCKACAWERVSAHQVALTNRQGQRAIVEERDIVGINQHPFARKLFMTSLNGNGLPAKVIVPSAFEDAKDFLCKYCE